MGIVGLFTRSIDREIAKILPPCEFVDEFVGVEFIIYGAPQVHKGGPASENPGASPGDGGGWMAPAPPLAGKHQDSQKLSPICTDL